MINKMAQIIIFAYMKLIAIKIVFHMSYKCAIMSEINNIASYRLLRHCIP